MENSIVKSKRTKEIDVNKTKFTAKEFKRQWILVAISAVYVIYGIIFYYLPLAGWIIAFQNFVFAKGIGGSKWVGIDKFKFLFSDKTFLMVIRNTFVMGVLNLFFSTVVAIAFAILLNEVKNRYFKKSIQTISYLPHFLSWIIVVAIVHDALTSTGIINDILMRLGILKTPYALSLYLQTFGKRQVGMRSSISQLLHQSIPASMSQHQSMVQDVSRRCVM